jgi:hypothetical protein
MNSSTLSKKHQEIKEIFDEGTVSKNQWKLPPLYYKKSSSAIQKWEVYINLFTAADDPILIKDKCSQHNQIAKIYTSFKQIGSQTKTVSEPTIISKGTNIGKKNETTPFEQAVYMIRSRYFNKLRQGYVKNVEELQDVKNISFPLLIKNKTRGKFPWRIFPEKIHDFSKHNKKIHEPFSIERKLDGIFATIYYNPALKKHGIKDGIDIYSIQRETIHGFNYIRDELRDAIKHYQDIVFCGEFYKHGIKLQTISGIVRQETDKKEELLLYLFDCFYIDKDLPYIEREKILKTFTDKLSGKYVKMIKKYRTNFTYREKYYQTFLKEGFEGAVIRNYDGHYNVGINRQYRSYDVQKLKPRPDSEWKIIGYKSGTKGKEVGAIIFICEVSKEITFSVTPNLSYEERYELYSKMDKKETNGNTHFENNYLNKMYKIQYSTLSKNGVPQQPKGLGIRHINY